MPKMTKCGACDGLKDELSMHIAQNAVGKSSGLKNGFSAVGLEYYILADYKKGDLLKFADFLEDGYTRKSILKLRERMEADGWIERVATRGWYRVIG